MATHICVTSPQVWEAGKSWSRSHVPVSAITVNLPRVADTGTVSMVTESWPLTSTCVYRKKISEFCVDNISQMHWYSKLNLVKSRKLDYQSQWLLAYYFGQTPSALGLSNIDLGLSWMGDRISMSISTDSPSDETLNWGPQALLLWRQYEFPFGINIVQFWIFQMLIPGLIMISAVFTDRNSFFLPCEGSWMWSSSTQKSQTVPYSPCL